MILVDLGGMIHANIYGFSKQLKEGTLEENEGLFRHFMLNSLLSIRKKYKKAVYGDIVIACDGRSYWRKEIFPQYKGNRAKAREESGIDWDMAHKLIQKIIDEIELIFPYRVVKVNRAEADDVVAVLVEYTQENELITSGLYPEPQSVLVVAEDTDFMQLFKYDNFKQYYPRKKKMAVRPSSKALLEFTREHVAKGDAGDGIPTILCEDDHFVRAEKVRAPMVTAKRLDEFKAQGRDACKDELEASRWDRNLRLVDFEYIPTDVKENIINTYKNSNSKLDRNGIFEYLIEKGCRQLMDSIEDF